MNPLYHGTPEDKSFFQSVEKLSDRELQEKQAHYLWEANKNTKRIKNNVVFFYYAFAVSIAISLLVLAGQ